MALIIVIGTGSMCEDGCDPCEVLVDRRLFDADVSWRHLRCPGEARGNAARLLRRRPAPATGKRPTKVGEGADMAGQQILDIHVPAARIVEHPQGGADLLDRVGIPSFFLHVGWDAFLAGVEQKLVGRPRYNRPGTSMCVLLLTGDVFNGHGRLSGWRNWCGLRLSDLLKGEKGCRRPARRRPTDGRLDRWRLERFPGLLNR